MSLRIWLKQTLSSFFFFWKIVTIIVALLCALMVPGICDNGHGL